MVGFGADWASARRWGHQGLARHLTDHGPQAGALLPRQHPGGGQHVVVELQGDAHLMTPHQDSTIGGESSLQTLRQLRQ